MKRHPNLEPFVYDELDRTGLPWEIVPGSKHNKIMLAGRMIGVFAIGMNGRSRERFNNRKHVKRIRALAAQIKENGS